MIRMLQPAFLLAGLLALGSATGGDLDWPADEWQRSALAEAGLDTEAILTLDREFRAGLHGNVDSMLIVRNGRIVFEAEYERDYAAINSEYSSEAPDPWNYYNSDIYPWYRNGSLHSLQSVTKSVMSALVGIAIKRGDLPGTEATLGDLLPHREISDPALAAIPLEHILTMRPGFEWNENISYFDPGNDATIVESEPDWVAYLLKKPMAAEPGTVYNYNSTNTQLLSEMVATHAGIPTDRFAQKYLFDPLGIRNYHWNKAPEGFSNAAGGLFLGPRDLARLALLFARDGRWRDQQLIPSDWVRRSATPWVKDVSPDDDDFNVGYGYQWWIFESGEQGGPAMYGGWGWGGQFPLIIPELDLVAVFTGWNIYGGEHESAWRLFYDRIVAER